MTANLSTRLVALLPSWRRRSTSPSPGRSAALWSAWMQAALRLPLRGKRNDARQRIELLDRLSLGGKKALLLVIIDGRRLLVGVGEDGAPSISTLDNMARIPQTDADSAAARRVRNRRRSPRARSMR